MGLKSPLVFEMRVRQCAPDLQVPHPSCGVGTRPAHVQVRPSHRGQRNVHVVGRYARDVLARGKSLREMANPAHWAVGQCRLDVSRTRSVSARSREPNC